MLGLLGGLFDFDGEGEMNSFEAATEAAFLHNMMSEVDETCSRYGYDSGEEDDDYAITELELSGLDVEELEFMDAEERREALEDAGLDPDDYDF